MSELTRQQQSAVEDRGGQILVSAAAGSGKTRVLVERLMRYLDAGEDIDRFLIITYTNAAAAELRGKILDALYEKIGEDPGNLATRRQAELLRRAHIETIHGFCTGVIRENAHVLGIQPDFRVADEAETRILKNQALTELLDEMYDSGDKDFYALADTMGAGRDDSALMEVILDTHVKLLSHLSPRAWVDKELELLALDGVTDVGKTVWGRVIMDRAKDSADYWIEQMGYLVDEAEADPKVEKGYGESFRGTLKSLRAFRASLDGSWDQAKAASAIAFPSGRLSGYDELKEVRLRCKRETGKISALFWDSSEKALADMRAAAPASIALLRTVLRFDELYGEAKRRRGALDFSDLEHMALRVLTDGEGNPTDSAVRIAGRFTEIMVDEYQDVNLIQETIFGAVSRDKKNIFTVGDVKQSIYRFRLADPTIFLGKYLSFQDAENAAEGEPRRIVLSNNFRSRPGILDAANFIFKNCMSAGLGDLDYTEREQLYPGAVRPESDEAEVELDLIDLTGNDDEEEAPDKSVSEAIFAAERIRELVTDACIPGANGEPRPVRYGDIAILMRSPRAALPTWERVFAGFGIPLASDQPTDFFTSHEVSLTMSILSVIDNPRQDIPLISVLRSPVFGFTSQELAEIRLYDREGDFWQALTAAAKENEKCAGFTDWLGKVRRASPDMTAEELLWYVYDETKLPAYVAAMPEGEKRRENLMFLIELAHTSESSGYRGLYGFLSWLQRLRERDDGVEKPGAAPGNAVRIMSIHKSKGLEFPIVFLGELTHRFNTEDTRARLLIHPELGVGPKLTDTERRLEYATVARRAVAEKLRRETLSEEMRVLYVAMTRAREKLIMLVTSTDASALVAKLANTPLPAPPELLRGCQSMAEWIMIPALRRPESDGIRYGIPNVPCDTGGVRWVMRLVDKASLLMPEKEGTESAKTPKVEVSTELREKLEFVYPHMAAANMPSKITATELKGAYKDEEANEEAAGLEEVKIPEIETRPPVRPRFMEGRGGLTPAQRGIAVHTVMQYADYGKCLTYEGAKGEVERLRAKRTITDEQAKAVDPEIISRFFASEPGKLILGADKLRRELKFSILANSGELPGFEPGEKVLLQGVVDCCAEKDGKLTVIDFKTDYVTPESVSERAEYYAGQLKAYALALQKMLHKPVERSIVCFLTAGWHIDV